MPDVYAETVRKLSDYVTSRLTGADDSCKRLFRDTNPSKLIIVGSLANVIRDAGIRKSSVQESSITLKFKTKETTSYRISVNYSTYIEDKLTAEEATIYPKIKKAWNRLDYSDSFILSEPGKKYQLSFNNGHHQEGYNAYVEYNAESVEDGVQITIRVQNDSSSDKADKYLFNVNACLDINENELIPYHYEYYYEKLKQYFDHEFRTINCTAYFDDTGTKLITSPIPVFDQVKEKLKNSDKEFVFDFNRLDSTECIPDLEKYGSILNSYQIEYESLQPPITKKEEFDNALLNFKTICDDYWAGVSCLKNDPMILKAFKMMNRTFAQSSEHSTWRMFQIIFIICNISKVTSPKTEEVCDVIHISTGGGKTEAYLGISVFLMFYARLTGKIGGNIAIVKFPLRMLSIQQVERVATKIVFAEKIRKAEKIPGYPFSTSFLVGQSNEYPNKTEDAIKAIRSAKGDSKGKILKRCPICGDELILKIKDFDSIHHYCKKCNDEYRLYYTDQESYRYLPTLIISTVDKFSSISQQRQFKNIFGAKLNICPKGHGMIPRGDRCLVCGKNPPEYGMPVDMEHISQPKLIIQDELHLIRESLGSIDAHFESFCEELQCALTNTRPKHIAMTATITGCAEQIDQLYNKKSKIFPGPNPYTVMHKGQHNNPFFEIEYDGDRPKLHRMIVGLKPNGRDNQYATNLSIKYAREFIAKLSKCEIDYDPVYGLNPDLYLELARNFAAILTYHNKKSDVYSTSHFMDPVLNDDGGPSNIQRKTLTGDSNVDEIREVIDSVKEFKTDCESIMHITSATNIVSHGVDLEKWNFMEFQGIPNNTAEYIQSRSRVGRKYVGLIFVWFYPNRVRDISFFHNFQEYHQIIDHKVEPVSINKWTKLSFYETCTSIFLGTVLNYLSAICEEPIYTQAQFLEYFQTDDPKHKDEVINFMKRVYHTNSDKEGAEWIDKNLPTEVEQRIKVVLKASTDISPNFFPKIITSNSNKYYGVQTGMRGIQKQVTFYPNFDSKDFVKRLSNE